jgi:ubiquitin-protein ligase
VKPDGGTPLWDCLLKARDDLVAANHDVVTQTKYPNAKLRILVISDGEDSSSEAEPHDVATALIAAGIVVDAVVINANDACETLAAVCHATGGLAFRPHSVNEGLALFEQEAFLNSAKRPPVGLQHKVITLEWLTTLMTFDSAVANRDLDIARETAKLATARAVVAQAGPAEGRIARLLKELKWAAAFQDRTARARDSEGRPVDLFDDSIRIYPVDGDIGVWRVFLLGPPETPYAGRWWYMNVTFPLGYPTEPPVFRFISVPFHLNVSSEGRICLNIFERGYLQNAIVVEMIQSAKELFVMPEEDTPIQLEMLALFRENKAEYDRRARESCTAQAKGSPEEWLRDLEVVDAPPDFQLDEVTFVRQWERSPFTGDPIPKDKQVRASSGVIYHRDELKQYVTTSTSPVCVITGKKLTEKAADFQ